MVTGVVPSSPRFLPSIFIAHRLQQSHCSSIFHRVLLTHALALSASHFVHRTKSPRIYTSMHSWGFELTKLTYTRLEDNLIRHRGDRSCSSINPVEARLNRPPPRGCCITNHLERACSQQCYFYPVSTAVGVPQLKWWCARAT